MGKTKTEKVLVPRELPEKIVNCNHEFLFIYDAKLCNPNGDPGNENKPRMDEEREVNLVSDVRLKRYIRDYLEQYTNKPVFVRKLDNKPAVPKKILENLKAKKDELEFKEITDEELFYLKNLIDIRMFGATMAIKNENKAFTGPIQVNWGYSLNPVYLNESDSITTTFTSTEQATQGSMGKDYRVNYSLIAFYGNIIAKKCEHTLLTDDDIMLFDDAIVKAIPLLATRTKIGQYPRLYLRIAYNSPQYLFGDLRKLIKFEIDAEAKSKGVKIETVRDVSEVILNVDELAEKIEYLQKSKLLDNSGKETSQLLLNNDKSFLWHNTDLKLTQPLKL